MAYPEEALASGEELVLHRHPHWKILVVPVLVLVGVVAVASFLAALVRNVSWAHPAWIALAAASVLAVGWFTIAPVLRWRTTHFVVTDRRILVRAGVFTRTGIDIPMSRINSVQFRHGLLDRVLRTGTLIVESASDEPLEFDDVPRVEQVHNLLYQKVFLAEQDAHASWRPEPAENPGRRAGRDPGDTGHRGR